MTKLQEKMELLKKEIKEIEILEKAEKNRNSQAEIIVKQTRRLMDIKNLNTMSPDACGVRMSTMAHFKMTYMSPICRPECPIKQTCSTLHNLSAKGSRKSSGTRKSSKDNIPILKDFSNASKGIFEFRFKDLSFGIVYTDFVSFKKELARILPRKKAIELGMKTGQYSGLMHFNGMRKNLKL